MRSVYRAQHVTEAQIVVDVLANDDIRAWIHGDALPGAAGVLPATALVDVMVDDGDFVPAREAIERWRATPVEPEPEPPRIVVRRFPFVGLVVGAALGSLVTWSSLRQTTSSRVDYDDDGHPEETVIYEGDRVARIDFDRDSDGKLDARQRFDADGTSTYEFDDDFDGRFEGSQRSVDGIVVSARIDQDGDGHDEIRTKYRHGVATVERYHEPVRDAIVVEWDFEGGVGVRSRIDTDGDGALDQERTHDARGEIVETHPIAR